MCQHGQAWQGLRARADGRHRPADSVWPCHRCHRHSGLRACYHCHRCVCDVVVCLCAHLSVLSTSLTRPVLSCCQHHHSYTDSHWCHFSFTHTHDTHTRDTQVWVGNGHWLFLLWNQRQHTMFLRSAHNQTICDAAGIKSLSVNND